MLNGRRKQCNGGSNSTSTNSSRSNSSGHNDRRVNDDIEMRGCGCTSSCVDIIVRILMVICVVPPKWGVCCCMWGVCLSPVSENSRNEFIFQLPNEIIIINGTDPKSYIQTSHFYHKKNHTTYHISKKLTTINTSKYRTVLLVPPGTVVHIRTWML